MLVMFPPRWQAQREQTSLIKLISLREVQNVNKCSQKYKVQVYGSMYKLLCDQGWAFLKSVLLLDTQVQKKPFRFVANYLLFYFINYKRYLSN